VRNKRLRKGLVTMAGRLGLCFLLLLGLAGWAFADDDIPVTCYKDGSRVGTATVFDWKTAAAACNSLYYDCRGKCAGCFRDNDYFDDVCVDAYRNEFLR